MEPFKYCKACLITERKRKMYIMNKSALSDAYTQLIQIPNNDNQLQYVCYECASLLKKWQQFRSKCITAHNLLADMENLEITEDITENLRKHYNLESKLMHCATLVYNDLFQLPKDCSDSDEKFYFNEIKTEIEGKLNTTPDFDVKEEISNETIQNEINENDITRDHDDSCYDTCDNYESFISQDNAEKTVKLKKEKNIAVDRKHSKTKRKKNSHREVKSKATEDMFSDLDDEPLAKRLFSKSKTVKRTVSRTKKRVKSPIDDETKSSVKKKPGPKFDASFFDEFATVVMLTPEDAVKEVQLRKESNNYKNCPFKCELCFRGFESKSTLNNHMKKHSLDYGDWKCDFCHVRFRANNLLYKHLFSCHTRKFYCKICPYTCFCTYQARTHISLHKGKKYPCKECDEIFSMPNSLHMHKRVKHVTQCVCELCGSTFATQRGLLSHKLLVHRKENNTENGPKCVDCDVQFATETAFKRHLVLSSKHKISNGCEYCGETFADEDALKTHLKVHSRKQLHRGDHVKLPAACEICDKWLTTRNGYKEHMTSLHPLSDAAKKIDSTVEFQCVCEVCGKVFKKPCFLLYHQRKHTGERPYACRECGKTFSYPGTLSAHRATHARARPHRCHACHKAFAFRSALTKHVKVAHLGIRPHKCQICDKGFPNQCDVKVHMKYVHCKVPWPKRDRGKQGARTRADDSTVL